MKKFLALILSLTMVMALVACGGEKTDDGQDGGDSTTPVKITLATGGTTGTYYAVGNALATTLDGKLSLSSLTAVDSGASKANVQLVTAGSAQMSILQSDVLNYAHNGAGGETMFDGAADMNSLWVAGVYNETVQLVTSPDITDISQLKGKTVCVPGLNCYSCPGAVGACPIGSLQAVIGSWNFKMAYYVVGFLIFIGAMVGRLICGFLCPFGLIQDLLNKIPFPKKIRTFKGDKLLRKLKYVIFAVFVILLPLFLVDIMGQGAPYFCKLICPAGTLEGGLPLVLLNKSMRSALGWLYIWKNVILVITIILSILIYRPFCKYICPLGALYSVFNPVSLYKYRVDKDKCIKCGKCAKACQMIVDPVENSNSPECIRCGRCRKVCPTDAIQCGIRRKPQS